jgi:hypothetical protein
MKAYDYINRKEKEKESAFKSSLFFIHNLIYDYSQLLANLENFKKQNTNNTENHKLLLDLQQILEKKVIELVTSSTNPANEPYLIPTSTRKISLIIDALKLEREKLKFFDNPKRSVDNKNIKIFLLGN